MRLIEFIPADLLSPLRDKISSLGFGTTQKKSKKPVGSLQFGSGVDSNINPQLANILTKVFAEFGQNLNIVSGYRSPARNKKAGGAKNSAHMRHNAVDVDTRALSHKDRLRLIRIASANGIGGIGVYNNNLHFDVEKKRAWGPNFSHTSIPGWARPTINAHLSGTIPQVASTKPVTTPQTTTATAPTTQGGTIASKLSTIQSQFGKQLPVIASGSKRKL